MEVDHRTTLERNSVDVPELSVLHVSQPTIGGVARAVRAIVEDQLDRGWHVSVACPVDDGLAEATELRHAVRHAWSARREPGVGLPVEVARLRNIIRLSDPDLVHLHSSKAGLAGRLALRGERPTIFHPHGWSFWALPRLLATAAAVWERRAASWTDLFICVSDGEREAGELRGVRGRWAIVANGVDPDDFPPSDEARRLSARRELGLGRGPIALCIGRLQRAKGQDVLLAAWPRVTERVSGGQLVLVGDGPDRWRLERRAPAGTVFAGAQVDVRPWLVAADVVVAPSRWEAGCPFAVVEAMACGRSVVATDVAGMAEAVAGAGAVVPSGHPGALAGAIATRLANASLAASEGRAGRARVLTHHRLADKMNQIALSYSTTLRVRGAQ